MRAWLYLALVVGLVVSHGWVYVSGGKHARNAIAAEHAKAANAAIARAREDAVADMQAAAEVAEAETRVEALSRQERLKSELDALRKSRLDCGRDGESMRMLLDAIRRANGDPAQGSGILPDPVRTSIDPGGRLGLRAPVVGD